MKKGLLLENYKKICNKFMLVFFVLVWMFLFVYDMTFGDNRLTTIEGIAMGEWIDTLSLGKWLLLIAPVVLSTGVYFCGETEIGKQTLWRFQSYRRWWWYTVITVFMSCMTYTAIGFAIYSIFGGKNLDAPIVLVLFIHFVLVSCFICFCTLLSDKIYFSVLIIFLCEGFSYIFSTIYREVNPYLIGTWGMYARSDVYTNDVGYNIYVVIMLQVLIVIVLSEAGAIIVKKQSIYSIYK